MTEISTPHGNAEVPVPTNKILRIKKVIERIDTSRSTIYNLMKQGLFPKNFQIGPRASGWLESDITQWIEERAAGRNQAGTKKIGVAK